VEGAREQVVTTLLALTPTGKHNMDTD